MKSSRIIKSNLENLFIVVQTEVIEKSTSMLASGAIDIESYDIDTYKLPTTLLIASLKQIIAETKLTAKQLEDIENLMNV
jgi:hypothetical protein